MMFLLVAAAAGCESDKAPDADGDGYLASVDCDDSDPRVNPGAYDAGGDGLDVDCDGLDGDDDDGDGYASTGTGGEDCDDEEEEVHPGRPESCDGLDNDCDGFVDNVEGTERYADEDGDRWGDDESRVWCSEPDGWVDVGGDCDDDDPAVNPSTPERGYDGVDNDCDASTLDWICGESAPEIVDFTISNGGLRDYDGGEYASVHVAMEVFDPDADLFALTYRFWWDTALDGEVNTNSEPDYVVDRADGAPECVEDQDDWGIYLIMRHWIEYATPHEFVAEVEDGAGLRTVSGVVAFTTPREDGGDG